MGEVLFVIGVVFFIARALYRFFRWAIQSLKRLGSPGPTYAPMQAPGTPSAPPVSKSSVFGKPSPMPRPALQSAFPEPVVTREATTTGFRSQEAVLLAEESQARESARRPASPQTTTPAPTPGLLAGPLFGTTNDLVRSLILQEALGPPLSRRRPGGPAPS